MELGHSYTLVHDDLPEMDGDEERRGKPSVWKKYGECMAILAGDALQALAFASAAASGRNVAAVVDELSRRAVGVVSGQVGDMRCGGERDVAEVYARKTADLFVAAARTGALSAGARADVVDRLGRFAHSFGMAFQHADDIDDGDSPYSGREAADLAKMHLDEAFAALADLPGPVDGLVAIAESLRAKIAV